MNNKNYHLYFPNNVDINCYLSQFKKSNLSNSKINSLGDDYLRIRLVAVVSFLFFSIVRNKDLKGSVNSNSFKKICGTHSSKFVKFVCSVGSPPLFKYGSNYKVGSRPQEYVLNEGYVGKFQPVDIFKQQDIDLLFSGYILYRNKQMERLTYPVPDLKAIAAQITVDRADLEVVLNEYIQRKNSSDEKDDIFRAESYLEVIETGPSHPSYYFTRDDSRLYSSITSCPRELRSLFRFNEKPFVELDQCASQPFLLLRLYQEIDTPEAMQEAAKYHSLWDTNQNNGDFYTNLIPNLKPEERSSIKRGLINDFLNRSDKWEIKKNDERKEWRSKIEEQFKCRFPILTKAIADLKSRKKAEIKIKTKRLHSQFAVKMQQLESIVFIDKIAAECIEKEYPIYTVHDCIGCLEEHKEDVTRIAIKHLTEFCGFEPRFK